MYINNIPITEFGGQLEAGYTVSGVSVTSSYTAGLNGSSILPLGHTFGLKTITLPITFSAATPEQVEALYSRFCAMAAVQGTVELVLPERRQYTALLQSIDNETWITPNHMSVQFVFVGYRHGDLQTGGSKVYCMSTLPETDCRLTATATADAARYIIGTVTVLDVKKGETIKIDGFNKRILINGSPAAQRAEWIHFPTLEPGENNIDCTEPDQLIAEYYPAYF